MTDFNLNIISTHLPQDLHYYLHNGHKPPGTTLATSQG